jgi:Ni/Fe-hydrogenase 1 B-type cytochrome subunit
VVIDVAHEVAYREEHPTTPRVLHWLHLISIVVLAISGLYISDPFFPYGMSFMRGAHIVFMWVLIVTLIWRVIWALVGKSSPAGQRERIRDVRFFGPQRENRGTLGGTVSYYLFMRPEAPRVSKYNGLQKATYVFWLLLIVLQAITGFALWSVTAAWFGPVTYALGGPLWIRSIHYLIMWVFVITTIIHLFLAALHPAQMRLMFLGRETTDADEVPARVPERGEGVPAGTYAEASYGD